MPFSLLYNTTQKADGTGPPARTLVSVRAGDGWPLAASVEFGPATGLLAGVVSSEAKTRQNGQ